MRRPTLLLLLLAVAIAAVLVVVHDIIRLIEQPPVLEHNTDHVWLR